MKKGACPVLYIGQFAPAVCHLDIGGIKLIQVSRLV